MSPLDRARSTSTGELKNRYTDDPEKIAAGRGLYLSFCGGCHGGTGGGGMAPPLSNEVWLYGSDDDTLFRLIALGTVELTKQGYTRRATEGVVGPMVPFGHLIKSDADLWKIIAYMRTTYRGRPEKRNW
jgi:mono/diheme cytochrome c family protein